MPWLQRFTGGGVQADESDEEEIDEEPPQFQFNVPQKATVRQQRSASALGRARSLAQPSSFVQRCARAQRWAKDSTLFLPTNAPRRMMLGSTRLR